MLILDLLSRSIIETSLKYFCSLGSFINAVGMGECSNIDMHVLSTP